MRGTMRNRLAIIVPPNTQYMTVRAPDRSDHQPPAARIRPEGRVKIEDSSPALATDTA